MLLPTPTSRTPVARSTAAAAIALLALAPLAACHSSRTGPYAPQSEALRDTTKAQRLTQEAAAIIDANPTKAEKLLREALGADLYHGPAHNNLGVLYLQQGKLYEAVGEFEWARKLMPGHPDPRLNLALTLERAGKTDDALAAYTSALEVYPGHIQSTQGLARLQIRSGKADDRTPKLLDDIALRGEDQRWREWARLQTLKR